MYLIKKYQLWTKAGLLLHRLIIKLITVVHCSGKKVAHLKIKDDEITFKRRVGLSAYSTRPPSSVKLQKTLKLRARVHLKKKKTFRRKQNRIE